MDVLSPQQRCKAMASNRSTNTKPEIVVRQRFYKRGLSNLFVLPSAAKSYANTCGDKASVGLTTHGCPVIPTLCCGSTVLASLSTVASGMDTRAANILLCQRQTLSLGRNRNRERDRQEQKRLADMGWHVIVAWKCQLKPDKREQTLASLAYTLNHIYLQDLSIPYPHIEEESDLEAAAEPLPE